MPNNGLLKQQEIIVSHSSLRSKYRRGWFLLRCEREAVHFALLVSSGWLAIVGAPWLADASPDLSSCSHRVLPVFVFVYRFPLFVQTQVTLY